jgi:hypothetical protein
MSDITALITNNNLNLPQEKITHLLSGLKNKTISYLSPDKESGCFLLYACGSSYEEIAVKTSYPVDIIMLTAIYYRWYEKVVALGIIDTKNSTSELQKDLLSTLLVATSVSIKKQLGDVIAGRADPKFCPLIPKTPQALKQLMDMINEMNAPKEEVKPQTVIHGTNVQVNMSEKKVEPISTAKLKALESF